MSLISNCILFFFRINEHAENDRSALNLRERREKSLGDLRILQYVLQYVFRVEPALTHVEDWCLFIIVDGLKATNMMFVLV